MTDEILCKSNQPGGNTTMLHQTSGKDEQWNSEEGKRIDTGVEFQGDRRNRDCPLPEEGRYAGKGHGESHWNIDGKQENKSPKKDYNPRHFSALPSRLFCHPVISCRIR